MTLFTTEDTPRSAIGKHQSAVGGQDEWLTPPHIIQALGPFDLDPCAAKNWPTAAKHYTIEDNGLTKPWHGYIWCNPPYTTASRWLAKLALHGNGIALLFARTETRMFTDLVWPHATALLFLRGRLSFHHSNGKQARANSGAPSVLVAYGTQAAGQLRSSGLAGALVTTEQVTL